MLIRLHRNLDLKNAVTSTTGVALPNINIGENPQYSVAAVYSRTDLTESEKYLLLLNCHFKSVSSNVFYFFHRNTIAVRCKMLLLAVLGELLLCWVLIVLPEHGDFLQSLFDVSQLAISCVQIILMMYISLHLNTPQWIASTCLSVLQLFGQQYDPLILRSIMFVLSMTIVIVILILLPPRVVAGVQALVLVLQLYWCLKDHNQPREIHLLSTDNNLNFINIGDIEDDDDNDYNGLRAVASD